MKRSIIVLSVLLVVLLVASTAFAGEFFFNTVMDKTISTSTGVAPVSLEGYKEFSVLARFTGPANSTFSFEISYNSLTVYRETVTLNASGWLNFAKVYPVYAPSVGLAVYNPPANLYCKVMFYAGH